MKKYIQIIRPLNLLITFSCILLTAHIINKISLTLLPIILVILLLGSFANVINDILDAKIDNENNLDRPIATGLISKKYAILYSSILLLSAICIIFYYNFDILTKFLILFLNLPLILLYTPIFKKIPLIGNLIVSFVLSMVFIVTCIYLKSSLFLILPIAILAFLMMVIREIVKDIADIEGDKKFGVNTLPVKYGIEKSFNVIILFSFLLIIISCSFIILYNLAYFISLLLLVILPLIYYLYQFNKNKTAIYCIYLAKVLKLITIFGVIVIYLASI